MKVILFGIGNFTIIAQLKENKTKNARVIFLAPHGITLVNFPIFDGLSIENMPFIEITPNDELYNIYMQTISGIIISNRIH